MAQEEIDKKKAMRAGWIVRAGASSAVTPAGRERIGNIEFHDGYAEPGYDGDLVATGNWNNITRYDDEERRIVTLDETPGRVGSLLEKIGVEIEWSDEWDNCAECQKLFRISPDSYGWTRCWVEDGEDRVCEECLDYEDHFKELEGDPTKCNVLNVKPVDHGYVKINDYERGLHPGQDADPHLIAKRMESWGIERFIFHMESKGQFDARFALYVHNDELEEGIVWNQYPSAPPKTGEEAIEALKEYFTRAQAQGPSISGAMEAALLAGSAKADKLEGEGIRVIKVTPKGSTAKLVSPEDFLEGKAFDD